MKRDLSANGLPLSIVVPPCAEPTAPLVRVADNARDVMLVCKISAREEMDGKQAFGIQVGLAKGKAGRKETAADPNFVRFTKTSKDQLEFESKFFQEVRSDFIYRMTKKGVEYACFPMSGTADPELLASEKAACLSIEAK